MIDTKEELHKILELVLALNEQGVTKACVDFAGHVEMVSVRVYEGKIKESTLLYREHCYYAGVLYDKEKLQGMIRALEELRSDFDD